MIPSTAFLLRVAGPVLGGAVFWLHYFDLKDALRPEPRKMLVLGFVLGGCATVIAAAGYLVARLLGITGPNGSPGHDAVYCLGVVGPVEEGAKYLVAWAFLFRSRYFDEPIDGLVYAASVAIGFATVENFLYAGVVAWPIELARAATTPLTHSVFSALWGFGAGQALLTAPNRRVGFLWAVPTLAAAAVAHGLYDAALLTLAAPWVASAIVLALWAFMIYRARAIVKLRVPRA